MTRDPSGSPLGQQPAPATSPTLGYAAQQLPPILNLKQVASQQRAINLCILGEIVALVAQISAKQGGVPLLAMAISIVYLAVAVTGAVFIFMLAISLYNVGLGVVLGVLTLVPILGLIILLIVNGKATKVLRQHGIRVGLLGANPAAIPTQAFPPPDAMQKDTSRPY
jgi:hypothetical protein